MWIALEGIDTSGKSTQVSLLKPLFTGAIFSLEPGGTALGAHVRRVALHHPFSPQTQFLLFLADRALHLEEVIKPNLNQLIISDRSLISGLAYSSYELERAWELHCAHGLDLLPDMVLLLKLDPHTLEARLRAKNPDGIELKGVDFLKGVQERLEQACALLGVRTELIDASKSVEEVHKIVLEKIYALRAL
ncbi:dTMP kinase [Helicobacter baculiformis]|uniref:Thymidylate kinase n=1 Tax=Helicobacter baculiformis TaxID=427351 RepID=A0ABV7ZIL4_9HELI|nr:dTMP kinase [Helicobacter baculiformis]